MLNKIKIYRKNKRKKEKKEHFFFLLMFYNMKPFFNLINIIHN